MNGGLLFDWDAHNISHLALHDVRVDEAEQTLASDLMDLDHRVTQNGEDRWTAVGQTLAGRVLVIVWTILDNGSHRPITVYPATKGLEAVYFGLKKEDNQT